MSFWSAKALQNFSAKNITVIDFVSTVLNFLTNDFIKLMVLWTSGPWSFWFDQYFILLPHATENIQEGQLLLG